MAKQLTELDKRNMVRLSNQQAKQLTKSCIHAALIQLLDSKDINMISVSELTRKAGVSRTAFYANYQTIDDVISEIINQELEILNVSIWEAINGNEDFFPQAIQRIQDNYELYALLMKSNIEKTTFLKLRDYIQKAYPSIDKETYYLMISAVSALKGIILEWFINDREESAEFISSICISSTENIRKKILAQ